MLGLVAVVESSPLLGDGIAKALQAVGVDAYYSSWNPQSLRGGTLAVLVRLATESDERRVAQFVASAAAPVSVLTPDIGAPAACRLIRIGVRNILPESTPIQLVALAVTDVVSSASVVPSWLLDSVQADSGATANELGLVPNEVAWLRDLSQGRNVCSIAAESGYSEREMFRRLNVVYRKLGATNRVEALLFAQRLGLLAQQAAATGSVVAA